MVSYVPLSKFSCCPTNCNNLYNTNFWVLHDKMNISVTNVLFDDHFVLTVCEYPQISLTYFIIV